MIIDCISKLPPYHQLYITHNGHNTNYESVEDYLEKHLDQVPECELNLMKEWDTIWEIQLYPLTPISFHWTAAATLAQALILMMMNYDNGKWN